jgi:hypothetical protein
VSTAPPTGLPYPAVVSGLASDAQPRSATETQGATTTTTPTEETNQLHVEVGEEDEIEIEETTELLRQMDIRELEKLERIAQVISKLKGGDGSIRIHGDLPLLDNPSNWAESEKWIANWKLYKVANPGIPQSARMTYNAIQYLRNNSAVEGKEADRLEELLEERRSKIKDNLLTNLDLTLFFPSPAAGDISSRIDGFFFNITTLIGSNFASYNQRMKEKIFEIVLSKLSGGMANNRNKIMQKIISDPTYDLAKLKEEVESHSDVFQFVEKTKYRTDAPVKVRAIEENDNAEREEVAMVERTENSNSESEDIRIRRLEEMTLQLQKNSEEILKRLLVGNHKRTNESKCEACGGTSHQTQNCWHRDRICFFCKQKGHLSNRCPKKPKSRRFAGQEKRKTPYI